MIHGERSIPASPPRQGRQQRSTSAIHRGLAACSLILIALALPAHAQTYPSRPLKLVVPYAPAGSVDLVGRLLAQGLSVVLGQSAVVENRAGGGGAIGAEMVAKAAPDGYTLLVAATGALTINVHLHKRSFDSERDLAPVSLLASSPLILAVKTSLPVTSVAELVNFAKAQPGGLSFSTNGPGSLSYLSVELLKRMTGMPITVLSYKGGGPAATAIGAGEVDGGITDTQVIVPLIKAARARGLAISDPMRSPTLPDLPTIAEAGVSGYSAYSWVGLFAPAGTPEAIIQRLTQATREVLARPGLNEQLHNAAMDARPSSPAELGALVKTESAKWRDLIREAGIKGE